MGVPTSEVGYTPAIPRKEDHEVHKDMWFHWTHKKTFISQGHSAPNNEKINKLTETFMKEGGLGLFSLRSTIPTFFWRD